MTGKEYIDRMKSSPLYKKMEELDAMFIKEDGTYDWDKVMKTLPIVITLDDLDD